MKKALAAFVIFLLVIIFSCYIFIPDRIHIQESMFIKSNPSGFRRAILNENKWRQWWPGAIINDNGKNRFIYNGFRYTLAEKKLGTFVFLVDGRNFSDTVLLHYITGGPGSVLLSWEAGIVSKSNPIERIGHYIKSKQITADLKTLLKKAVSYFSQADNLYDAHIEHLRVVDSTLLFTAATSKNIPGTEFIYGLIDQLEKYATSRSAKVTGYPMLNISTMDSISFLTKVAIPVDKKLSPSGNISYRWMLGGGNILATDVKGGPEAIVKAAKRLEEYVTDHGYISPAISFQSLITNRLKEKDTSKWITRIYYPIM
jgi:hypothetical protein